MSVNNMSTSRRTTVGVFESPRQAELALDDLRDAGVTPNQVSVVARDTRAARDVAERADMADDGGAGTGTGAVLGGITGGVLGWLVGIGALIIPGIGPIVAAGALATTLGGAALGAATGGLLGALVDLGIPEDEARAYETSVREGRLLVTVTTGDDVQARDVRRIFDRHQGLQVGDFGSDASVSY